MALRIGSWMVTCSLIVGVLAGSVGAQDSPADQTRQEALCQGVMGRALGHLAAKKAGCLADCRAAAETDPGRRCDPFGFPGPDGETAACLDIAAAKATLEFARQCGGSACPECYQRGDCHDFGQSVFSDVDGFLDSMSSSIFCSDDFGDGLTPVEADCQQAAYRELGKLIGALSRCVGQCGRSQPESATECLVTDSTTSPLGAQMARCVRRARSRFLDRCARRCADQPECGFTNCEDLSRGAFDRFQQGFSPLSNLGCVDHTVCGDGFISGSEQCDVGSFPTACSGATPYCNAQCQCEPARECGDGIISGGESCDDSASLSGCAPDLVCAFQCSFCTPPFCGDGVVSPTVGEECDPSAAPTCAANERCASCQCQEVVDACTQVADIPPSGGVFTGATSGFSSQEGTCGVSLAPERVYRWIPDSTGMAIIDACSPGNFFHAMVYVREETCTGPEVVCAQHSSPSECFANDGGRAAFPVMAGTAYFVFIDGWNGESGAYTLRVTPPGGSPSGAFVY